MPATDTGERVIRATCAHCGQELDVVCVKNTATDYLVDCPVCDKDTITFLPGDILDVWKRGEQPHE
jgi:transcription elongation factor Elf1